jgi:hypothetical protein
MNHYTSHYLIIIIFLHTLMFELLFLPQLMTYIHCNSISLVILPTFLDRIPFGILFWGNVTMVYDEYILGHNLASRTIV